VFDGSIQCDDEIRSAFNLLRKSERNTALGLAKYLTITKQAKLTYNPDWRSAPSEDKGADLPLVVLWGEHESTDGNECLIYVNRIKVEAELKRLDSLNGNELEPIVNAVSILLHNAAMMTVNRLCEQHCVSPQELFVNNYV